MIRNLVSNSIKFTDNGTITLSSIDSELEFNISILDTGIGIDEEKLNSLFNWSKITTSVGTNGEKGTGFGLLVVNEFVLKHNGTIKIKSEVNKGTEIILSFKKS